MRYGLIALAVVVVGLGIYFYRGYQHSVRQEALHEAIKIQDANVQPGGTTDLILTFPTKEAKEAASTKAFTDLYAKYNGTSEGTIAQYYLATIAADKGNLPEAEKRFKDVADSGEKAYASLAKMALAQIYASTGRMKAAEDAVKSVMEHPTVLVSKEQATIEFARLISRSDPARARKLLEPMRAERSAVSRAALTALSDLPQK